MALLYPENNNESLNTFWAIESFN